METPPIKMSVAEQVFGANKAPLADVLAADFAELFKEAEALAAEVKDRPTKIKDEADFAAIGAVANKVKVLAKRLDDTRLTETNPLRQAGIEIKAAFDIWIEGLNAAFAPHQKAANTYTTEKAARERREREAEAARAREAAAAELAKAEKAKTAGTAARAEGRAEAFTAQADKLEQGGTAADAVRTKIAGGGVATAKTGWDFSVEDYDALDLNQLRQFIPRPDIDKAIRSVVRIQKGSTKLNGVKVFEAVTAAFR